MSSVDNRAQKEREMTSLLSTSAIGGPGLTQDGLEQAASMVDHSMLQDRNYLDLSDLLQLQKHNQPTASGLLDLDYPILADPKIGLGSILELGELKKVPLPAELVEQFGHMQCNCMMGLFPEISRAWLSIDSDIFVWNYEDGSDLAYFDGLRESILCAGLVKPKPGIFQPHIQYLLCLASPLDIVLLGVSFSKPFEAIANPELGYDEMHLLPEPLFSIPTDNVQLYNIVGTENGRIFMAGKDGCLYELVYQAEDGWFSRKCRKINHSKSTLSFVVPSFLNFSFVEDDPLVQISVDDTRHILYCRSEKGSIQVFDLGADGKGLSKVAAISQHTIMQNASLVARTLDKSNFKPIVHISAIPATESNNIHLVAITHTGVRLYFTTGMFEGQPARPYMLTLVHVRLPPGFTASAPPKRPTNIHSAHYKRGTLMMCGSQSEDNDVLWTITGDAFPFQNRLSEKHETQPIDGRTWAIGEVPSSLHLQHLEAGPYNNPPRPNPPVVVMQHMRAKRKFVLINSQGSYLLTKQQPVDQLKQLLEKFGPDSPDTKAFFNLHQEQACATCLVLACSTDGADAQVAELATRAFFLYGGEPEYNFNVAPGKGTASTLGPGLNTSVGPGASYIQGPTSPGPGAGPAHSTTFATPGPGLHPNQMSTPFPHVQQQLQFQTPASPGATMPTPGFGGGPQVLSSGKHWGLCLFLARLLRPLWDERMVSGVPVQTNQGQTQFLSSQFTSSELSWILKHITALREFLDRNSQFASPLLAESFAAAHNMSQRMGAGRMVDGAMEEQLRKKYQADANAQESLSLKQIQQLVGRACEALGLWNVLCDHQFHVIASKLTKDLQNTMRTMNFRTFVTQGKDVSSALITSLINMYIDDNAATDAISSRLRDICPSLYSPEDAVCSKANEKLKSAKTTQTLDQENLLEESLQMFKQITNQLDLPTVCNQFGTVRFYRGIVDLSLTSASKRDPQGFALHFYRNGEPPEDYQGLQAYRARMDSYKCVTETLDFLLSTSMTLPQAISVPKSPGPPPPQDPNRLSNTEAEKYAEEVFNLAVKSDDEMFHVHLYEWLIKKNLSEKLLEIQSPFLEPYLKRSAQMQPDHLASLDLLWRYHEKTKNYSAAARILAKLADRHSTDLTLTERREYLSRACMCAKSSTLRTSTTSDGEFLHQLEEKMEVARLQLEISETLSKRHSTQPQVEDALKQLNSQLMDITTLYGEFADQFDLSECKLAIIRCAGHHDPTLVESLWQDLIEKELQLSHTHNPRTRIKTISNKLVTLGRTYGGTERYFPLPFLVYYLEKRSCELGLDRVDLTFVFQTMQEIGITIPRLHEIYDRQFKSKDPCWKAARKQFHLLFVVHRLLESFADTPSSVPAYEKRHFTTTCLDAVSSYLVELQAESSTNETVRILMANFKDLQAKLERLI